jgi:hypothetical protein
VVALAAVVAGVRTGAGGSTIPAPPRPGRPPPPPPGDALAYRPGMQGTFGARAAVGEAQVLFTESPGGALATAARVARWRGAIDAAVRGTSIPAALLEGMVFLESAGRPQVIAGSSVADAAGLTQIVAATGQALLGMHIELASSAALSARIGRAQASGHSALAASLERRRAQVDPRFDPTAALAATVRYLELARAHFGRLDLAVESYHMGIGNLQDVLDLYDGGAPVPYAQLFFDTAPDRHPAAYRLLWSFADDSELYLWRVMGAERIMHLYRFDRRALARLSALEAAYPSDAEALLAGVRGYRGPAALSGAYRSGALVPLPRQPGLAGLAYAPGIGSLSARLHVPRALYAGLRPAALRLLEYLAGRVRAISATRAPLILASAVQDERYQRAAGIVDPPAATGYTFLLERRYATPAQAEALQSLLDRLQALAVLAWLRGTSTLEITVAPDAGRLLARGR